MKDFKPAHPLEFLIEEFHFNPYKAQLLIGDRVTEVKATKLKEVTGWGKHMWLELQEQYDRDMEEDES